MMSADRRSRFAPLRGAVFAGAVIVLAVVTSASFGQDPAESPQAARRAAVLAEIEDGLAIVPARLATPRGPQENKDFYYLTGLEDAEAVLVLTGPQPADAGGPGQRVGGAAGREAGRSYAAASAPNTGRRAAVADERGGGLPVTADGERGASPRSPQDAGRSGRGGPAETSGPEAILFNRSGRWTGPDEPGAPAVRPLTDLRMYLQRSARGRKIYLPFSGLDGTLQALGGGAALSGAEALVPVEPVIAPLRMIKSADEIEILRRAIDVTAEAYTEVLKAVRPGMTENDLNAIIQFVNMRHGGTSSFTQVASGPNSVNIHFGATDRVLRAGDVIVFDMGVWLDKNTSDISRTIPVSGRFSREQAEIYALVLRAQKEAIRLMTPGRVAIEPQEAAERVLLEGLRDLGLVTDPASPWQRRLYIQHGFGHGIGLDVHDVWSWWSPRMRTETLRPGMVLTMEPGLYFPEGRLEQVPAMFKGLAPDEELKSFVAAVAPVYEKYMGLGCRIEDDILITADGNEILSAAALKEMAEMEKAIALASPWDRIFK